MRANNEVFYDILEDFFSAMLIFEEQRDEYEQSVLMLAARDGVDRKELRLPAREVAGLLDFKVLTHLRDRYLLRLRENVRHLFGGRERDIVDILVSDIYHLVSILKEEEFRVSHYAVLYDKMERTQDRDYILESVHHDFPLLLNQTHDLFLQVKERLQKYMVSYSKSREVVRSLFLFGGSYLDVIYADEGGMDGFYRHLYPDGGALEAYVVAGRSFLSGGFADEATTALEQARKCVDVTRTDESYLELVSELDELQERLLAGD